MTPSTQYSLVSLIIFGFTISNSIFEFRDFYAVCVSLTNDSISLVVLFNLFLVLLLFCFNLLVKLFFSSLRQVEIDHLYDKSWFALTETCLAMSIFRDQVGIKFLLLFSILLFQKVFHWILEDRIDFIQHAEPRPNIYFHVRTTLCLLLFTIADLLLLSYSINYTLSKGHSMMIIFAFENSILLTLISYSVIKYSLQIIEIQMGQAWSDKGMYILYLDLIVDFIKLVAYFIFFCVLVYYYGLPLHIIRDLYLTFRSFLKRLTDVIKYRRATNNMDARYPTATIEDLLETDRVCIICREEMGNDMLNNLEGQVQPRDVLAAPKKLVCGHIFHMRCLKSWLERQQSCPTCRRSVLEVAPPPPVVVGVNWQAFPNQFPVNQQGLQQGMQGIQQDIIQPGIQIQGLNQTPATPYFPSQSTVQATSPTLELQDLEELNTEKLLEIQGNSKKAIIKRLLLIQKLQAHLNSISDQLKIVLVKIEGEEEEAE